MTTKYGRNGSGAILKLWQFCELAINVKTSNKLVVSKVSNIICGLNCVSTRF